MALTNIQGRAYKLAADLKPGEMVQVDEGFTYIRKGGVRIVKRDENGFYIRCKSGKHYLDGQKDDRDGTDALIGIYPYP